MGAGSAAVYFDIDCRFDGDLVNAIGLFQTPAVIIGRDFDLSDDLDGQTYADFGR